MGSSNIYSSPQSILPSVNGAYVQSRMAPIAQYPSTAVRKYRHSKGKLGKTFSSALSTPRMNPSIMSDAESDKKRNKLGYQRISIACSHCRRRKIRCLPAEGDSHQRCQNCIRLKKECVYYPVEQQHALDTKLRSSSTGGVASGPSSSISSSSPEILTARRPDDGRDYSGFSSLRPKPSYTYAGIPLDPAREYLNQGAFPQVGYEYQPTYSIQPDTHSPEMMAGASPTYWRYQQGTPGAEYEVMPVETTQPSSMAQPFEHWQQTQPILRSPSHAPVMSSSNPQMHAVYGAAGAQGYDYHVSTPLIPPSQMQPVSVPSNGYPQLHQNRINARESYPSHWVSAAPAYSTLDSVESSIAPEDPHYAVRRSQ